ncbi:uncharacterized protein LOC135221011 [Macrobrachium nipponense]|uniref:uncharacterized protein LOC135221011 n=1 Tax=Macrobrachium nipponense TaxID=159736 RepID=UPI0030C8A4EC
MSSSCVPPKGSMVSHDPDPRSNSERNHGGDTDSECGSFCTCTTSSSTTSLATSVTHPQSNEDDPDSRRSSSASAVEPLPEEDEGGEEESSPPQTHERQRQQQAASAATPAPAVAAAAAAAAAAQPAGANGSSYFVVFVPPTMLPGQSNTNCGNCHGHNNLNLTMKTTLMTALEFCPWIAGIVFIYYAFYLWGIGPGFSAFLFMMGTHAFIRFLRTKGPTKCGLFKLNRVDENNPPPETTDNEETTTEVTVEVENADAPDEIENESPPSYEVAVVKPPPYDLYHHLTPTQPRTQFQSEYEYRNSIDYSSSIGYRSSIDYRNSIDYSSSIGYRSSIDYRNSIDENFLSVPQMTIKKEPSEVDEDDDIFLPSYNDAIRLSICSGKSIEAEIIEENEDSKDKDKDKDKENNEES